jgi:AcrR family transcriptional regulator
MLEAEVPPMSTASRPHTDPRVERTRAAVLDAVAGLLVEHGPAEVTVDAVIARSGAARATIYRHWPSREALVVAGLEHLMPPPRRVTEPDLPVDRAVAALVRGFAAQLADEQWAAALPALLDAARRQPELGERMLAFLEQRKEPVREVLRRAVHRGELDAALDLDAAVAQLVGPLFFRRTISGEPLDEGFLAAVVAGFLDGHRARSGGGPSA